LSGRVVHYLPRHGPKLESNLKPFDRSTRDRQEIEEESSVILGRQKNQVPSVLGIDPLVNIPNRGCLPAQGTAIVNDLKFDLSFIEIYERHRKNLVLTQLILRMFFIATTISG